MTLIEMDKTLLSLPSQARQEVLDFVEFLAQKYVKAPVKTSARAGQDILDYAGAWSDMDEGAYQSMMQEIAERRASSFSRRRSI